jgi:hypothetical protein
MNTSLNINLFKDAVAFTLTNRRWGNRRQGDVKTLIRNVQNGDSAPPTAEEVKRVKQLKLSKQLVTSKTYDAILAHQAEVYTWCMKHCVPSFFKEGIYLVRASEVDSFEKTLTTALNKLNNDLVPAFLKTYQNDVDEAKKNLTPLGMFNKNDYPSVDELRVRFGIEWNWISFNVPENMPENVRKAEVLKIEQQFKDAETKISLALAEGFQGILDHIVDRLESQSDGKEKIFRDSLFEDLTDFVSTFNSRNLVNDTGLAALVEKAEGVLRQVAGTDTGMKAKTVRDSLTIKQMTAKAFETIKQAVSESIVEKKSRKFDFNE